jgi:hypothetical protein
MSCTTVMRPSEIQLRVVAIVNQSCSSTRRARHSHPGHVASSSRFWSVVCQRACRTDLPAPRGDRTTPEIIERPQKTPHPEPTHPSGPINCCRPSWRLITRPPQDGQPVPNDPDASEYRLDERCDDARVGVEIAVSAQEGRLSGVPLYLGPGLPGSALPGELLDLATLPEPLTNRQTGRVGADGGRSEAPVYWTGATDLGSSRRGR